VRDGDHGNLLVITTKREGRFYDGILTLCCTLDNVVCAAFLTRKCTCTHTHA